MSLSVALVKVHFEHEKVKKERESFKTQLSNLKTLKEEADVTIKSQESEIGKLNQIIKEADAERQRQKKDYDTVINERVRFLF